MRGPFRPSKSRGQNFLVDPNISRKLIDLLDPGPGDTVLEVGPGKGALTEVLVERGLPVIAVEVQAELAAELRERDLPGVRVVEADFLAISPAELALPGRCLALSNVPYSITGGVLTRFLSGELPVDRVVVGVQREVAERLLADPGSKTYGSLSLLGRAYGPARKGFKIPASCYRPRPRVESMAVRLDRDPGSEPMAAGGPLEKMARAAFATRRKTLLNSLSGSLGRGREEVRQGLEKAGVDPGRRAESLTIEELRKVVVHLGSGPSTAR